MLLLWTIKTKSLEERPPPRVNVVSLFLLANLSKLFEKGTVIPNLKKIGKILRPLERIYLYIILVGEDNLLLDLVRNSTPGPLAFWASLLNITPN